MNDLVVLIILYSIIGAIYATVIGIKFGANRTLNGALIVRLMYMLIYSITPIIVFINLHTRGVDYYTRTLSLTQEGFKHLYIFVGLSFLGFWCLEAGLSRKYRLKNTRRTTRIYGDQALWNASILMTLISLFALFLWTYPFGGPFAIIEYGSMLRSGYEIAGMVNSFGFMKHLVPLAQFSSIICLGLLRKNQRAIYFIHFTISFAISLLYLIANDGRAPFMMYFVSLLVLVYMTRRKTLASSKIKIAPMVIIVLVGIFLLENLDTITNYIRTGEIIRNTGISGIAGFVYTEFSWTVRNAQAVQEAAAQGESNLRLGIDLLSALFALVPSKLTPSWIQRLEFTNTRMWFSGMSGSGGKPTDIITTGLYEISLLGVVVLPYVYGAIVKWVDARLADKDTSLYHRVLFVQLMYQFAKTVAYADFALVSLNLFYIIVGHILVVICANIKLK